MRSLILYFGLEYMEEMVCRIGRIKKQRLEKDTCYLVYIGYGASKKYRQYISKDWHINIIPLPNIIKFIMAFFRVKVFSPILRTG